MREKLKNLARLLQGDSNPKWTALLELLTEIVNKISDKVNESTKPEDNDDEDPFDKFSERLDKLMNDIPSKIDGIFKKINSKLSHGTK